MRGAAIVTGAAIVLGAGMASASSEIDGGESALRATLAAYDAGRYAEACPSLETLAEQRATLDGPMTYRLFFCRRQRGDARAAETLNLARTRLAAALPAASELAVPFYLVNALQNLEEFEEARRIAHDALSRIKSGTLPSGDHPADRFRLAKLHADLGLDAEAEPLYTEALAGFESDGQDRWRPYVLWASRWIGERAFARGDWPLVDRTIGALVESNDASMLELDRLAVARARSGRFADARSIWERAEKADPANADRARYCARIAELAAELAPLPETDPKSGKPFRDLSEEELQTVMKDQADVVRSARREAGSVKRLKKKTRSALASRIATARPLFVAAALEYALDDLPIRETLFQAGLAQLLFWPQEWELEPPPAG